jgi:hypothetical protein
MLSLKLNITCPEKNTPKKIIEVIEQAKKLLKINMLAIIV